MKDTRENNILLSTISPKFLRMAQELDAFVAGGCIRDVFIGEKIHDVDIFFRDRSSFDMASEVLREDNVSPTFTTTETAWTHRDGKMQYQLICAEFGTPVEILAKFDFTCCMAAWSPVTRLFNYDPLFLKHCAQKRLVFNPNAGYPICSLWRAIKFVKRGWILPAVELIKIALCINNLQLKNKGELKRQLMGIDTLFLIELTDALDKDRAVAYDFGEAINLVQGFIDKEEEQ